MKDILITGGAGFIGLHLARELLNGTEAHLVLIDNLQRGRMDEDLKSFLESNKERVEFVNADLTDPAAFPALGKTFDHVYHLAAINGTKHFYAMPHEVLRINTQSLANLLEWIKTLEKKPKLCFTSSNEAYAGALSAFDRLPIPTPEGVPLVIEDPYNPRWTYAATKLIGELYVIHYARQYDFPAVIVRPHNFYGPRAGYDHVIPEFCERVLRRIEPFPIYGSEETRTFCYIDDAVRAMRLLMESEKTNERVETVHIGHAEEIRIQDLAETLFRVAGWKPSRTETKASPTGSVKRRLADISKIEELVGWKPGTSLEEGLAKTLAWYKKYPKSDAS